MYELKNIVYCILLFVILFLVGAFLIAVVNWLNIQYYFFDPNLYDNNISLISTVVVLLIIFIIGFVFGKEKNLWLLLFLSI